jgi:hypothetical protein
MDEPDGLSVLRLRVANLSLSSRVSYQPGSKMTIDATLENIAAEMERRWSAIVRRKGSLSEAILVIMKNTTYKTLMCANAVKQLCGSRISPINISVKNLAKSIDQNRVRGIIAVNKSLTDYAMQLMAIAENNRNSSRISKMINEYINESEKDLHKLYLLEKRTPLTGR